MIQRRGYYAGRVRRIFVKVLILLHAFAAAGYPAQASLGSHSAEFPSDLHLGIRALNNQSSFQIGEVIQVELSFTSAAANKYRVALSAYLLGGGLDRVAVEPRPDWDDPLNAYLNSCLQFRQGGFDNSKVLSLEPAVVIVRLNEWVRFMNPGKYRITIQSDRVAKLNSVRGRGQVSLRSNTLSLTVIPATERWQRETLENAVAVLESPHSAADLPWVEQGARKAAAKALRFLGTAAAARAMGRHYQDWSYDFLLGLVGSPAREAALDQMKALLIKPHIQVTGQFLCAMSIVALAPDAVGDIAAQRKALEARFRDELSSALKNKLGPAREVCSNTVNSER